MARRIELINLPQGFIPLEEGERLRQYAYRCAGSSEVFEQKRAKIEATFDELNSRGIEFIVFRTFRRYPNFWDTLYFYSLGGVR
ncbi:hypothetical protein HY637_03880 [Candidatus Woesearchaeota archaeon]|nr:hypothetical protein [Candidatus Woesearchaeota archaeon]